MLIDYLNETHKGQFDFLYLRMVRIPSPLEILISRTLLISVMSDTRLLISRATRLSWRLRIVRLDSSGTPSLFLNMSWQERTKFNSDKICMLSYANIQGRTALIDKFRNSSYVLTLERENSWCVVSCWNKRVINRKCFIRKDPWKAKKPRFLIQRPRSVEITRSCLRENVLVPRAWTLNSDWLYFIPLFDSFVSLDVILSFCLLYVFIKSLWNIFVLLYYLSLIIRAEIHD